MNNYLTMQITAAMLFMLVALISDSGGLKVLASPPSLVHVGEGETVVLECAASDNPLPQISWVNGGKLIYSDPSDLYIRVTLEFL